MSLNGRKMRTVTVNHSAPATDDRKGISHRGISPRNPEKFAQDVSVQNFSGFRGDIPLCDMLFLSSVAGAL